MATTPRAKRRSLAKRSEVVQNRVRRAPARPAQTQPAGRVANPTNMERRRTTNRRRRARRACGRYSRMKTGVHDEQGR